MTYTKNKLSFPRSIKTIEAYAFNDSGSIVYSSINRGYLIYIPYEVESIGAYAFGKDNNEPTIDCERSDGFYKSTIWNWNAVITRSDNTTDFIPTSYGVSKKSTADFEYIECADGVALIKYIGASTNVVIPEMIEGKKVIDFNGCFTNNITIKSVEILAKVARLNGFEFKGCSNLTTVIFPEGHSIKDLGYKTFKDTAIKTFVVPANVELINNAFAGAKSLEFVSFAGNKLISSGNFADCTALKGIRYPDSLKTLNKGAFANCTNLVAVYLPASLEKVEMDDESNYTCGAFRGLSKVTIVYNTLPNQSNFHKNWDTYQWNGVNVSGKGTVCKKKTGTSVVYLEGKMYYVDMTGQNILLG